MPDHIEVPDVSKMSYDKYLEWYYSRPYAGLANPATQTRESMLKGYTMTGLGYVGPAASLTWFDPVYSGTLALQGLTRSTSLFKLLPKTTYQQRGDSYQTITAETTEGMYPSGEAGLIFTTETTTPTITDVNSIIPAVIHREWEDTTMAVELSKIQRSRTMLNPGEIKKYQSERFLDDIDRQLAGVFVTPATSHGIDDPATNGTYAELECIDRMVTSKAENTATTYNSANTDGNIYWNNTGLAGTARYDRNAGTDWNGQVRLPTGGTVAAGEAYNILDELDDLMAIAKCYATQPYNYIGLCSPKALNKIQNEIDPKQRWLEGPTDVTQTINGVTTRPGVEGGKVSVSSLTISGIKVPMFESPYLMGTATSNWLWMNTKHTTGGPGNIYLVNMDAIEIRTLVPITYETWPAWYGAGADVADAPAFGNKHVLYMMAQLIAWNWQSHAALKYIAT